MKREQLRICRFVHDLLPPEQSYGYFVSFYYISKVQRNKNQKVLILKPAKSFSKEMLENFPIISIPLRKRGIFPSDRREFLKTIKALVDSWDADIIHTHISIGNYLHGTQMLPPTVHHLHGLPYKAFEIWRSLRKIGQRKGRFLELRHDLHADSLYRRYLRKANAVVLFCLSIRADIIQRYKVPPDKVHVVFNGVSPVFLKPYPKLKMRKELNLDDDRFIVLYVGRLVEGKGIIPLLKALRLVKKKIRRKDIQLLIIGSQFGTDWLRSLVRSAASRKDFVIEIPHVPYANLPKYYAAADLFYSGAFAYGFPKTCLESLACGTPVTITKTLDTEVIIGQNERGMLLNSIDHIELVKKISYFMEHEDLARKMGEKGRRLIHKKFTWERTVENLNSVYSKVLDDY